MIKAKWRVFVWAAYARRAYGSRAAANSLAGDHMGSPLQARYTAAPSLLLRNTRGQLSGFNMGFVILLIFYPDNRANAKNLLNISDFR